LARSVDSSKAGKMSSLVVGFMAMPFMQNFLQRSLSTTSESRSLEVSHLALQ